jgi:hypothetical protein
MLTKKYALYDTETAKFLSAEGGFVWASEFKAKTKYNNFARYGLSESKPFSQQKRVVLREVHINAS